MPFVSVAFYTRKDGNCQYGACSCLHRAGSPEGEGRTRAERERAVGSDRVLMLFEINAAIGKPSGRKHLLLQCSIDVKIPH